MKGARPEHAVFSRDRDFCKVASGRITDNWVIVDFPHVMAQLGVDCLNGNGWEAFDHGANVPPRPVAAE